MSGLVGSNKDFALTLSQKQPLESSEQKCNMGPLKFLKIQSGCSVESGQGRAGAGNESRETTSWEATTLSGSISLQIP